MAYKLLPIEQELSAQDLDRYKVVHVKEHGLQVLIQNEVEVKVILENEEKEKVMLENEEVQSPPSIPTSSPTTNSITSPTPTPLPSSHSTRIAHLQLQIQTLSQSTPTTPTNIESQYKQYIDLLHRYNDVKDVTQTLLGKLAELTQRTVTDLHREFGLE